MAHYAPSHEFDHEEISCPTRTKGLAMELIEKIEQAIDGTHRDNCSCWIVAKDVKAAIRALPEFAPVEPKDWPDAEGWWRLQDTEEVFRTAVAPDGEGDIVLIDRCGNLCHKTVAGVRSRSGDPCRRTCLAVRGFVRCHVITPPAKEPEPVPERPVMLLCRLEFMEKPTWFVRHPRGYYWEGNGLEAESRHIIEINESASDPEAVRLWRKETN